MQEYWNGLPFPSPGYLSDTKIEPEFPALQADSFTTEPHGKPYLPKASDLQILSYWGLSLQEMNFGGIQTFSP